MARTTAVDYYRSKQLDLTELDEDLPDTQSNDELLHRELAATQCFMSEKTLIRCRRR